MLFEAPDWPSILGIETSVWELIGRAAILYAAITFLLRVMPRRAGNQLAAMDLVFLLLVTEAASHALGDFSSIGDGLVMIVTLVALDYLINSLTFHSKLAERILTHSSVQIVRDGKMLRREMRREYLTEDELMAYLRSEGIDQLSKVKKAFVESDGRISVVPKG